MPVFKANIEFTVLLEATDLNDARATLDVDVEQIANECSEGIFLGGNKRISLLRQVSSEDVCGEEQALGSDGSFFADADRVL